MQEKRSNDFSVPLTLDGNPAKQIPALKLNFITSTSQQLDDQLIQAAEWWMKGHAALPPHAQKLVGKRDKDNLTMLVDMGGTIVLVTPPDQSSPTGGFLIATTPQCIQEFLKVDIAAVPFFNDQRFKNGDIWGSFSNVPFVSDNKLAVAYNATGMSSLFQKFEKTMVTTILAANKGLLKHVNALGGIVVGAHDNYETHTPELICAQVPWLSPKTPHTATDVILGNIADHTSAEINSMFKTGKIAYVDESGQSLNFFTPAPAHLTLAA